MPKEIKNINYRFDEEGNKLVEWDEVVTEININHVVKFVSDLKSQRDQDEQELAQKNSILDAVEIASPGPIIIS